LKILACPGKDGIKTPPGKLTVSISVSVAVLLPQGPALLLVALMVTGKTPMAVGVPEITPVVVSTANPPGRSLASKLIGLLSAVI